MRVVLQRVKRASIVVDSETVGSIQEGLLVLVGIVQGDTCQDAEKLAEKIVHLRIFSDECGKMNCSLLDVKGELLLVSNFTLGADCRKGRRPSFENAAPPKEAFALYQYLGQMFAQFKDLTVAFGTFGAAMQVYMEGDGPVTIMLDSAQFK